jgi:hypothetical protein
MRAWSGPVAIFLTVSTEGPHNVAIAVLFVLLGGMLLLSVAPYEVGAIRLAGVSLLWWYGMLAVPIAAAAVAVAALARRAAPRAGSVAGPDGASPASE